MRRGRSEKESEDSTDNSITRTLGDASSMISRLQVNAANGLNLIDEVGSWNIASCLVVLNVFVWETYSMDYLSAAVRRPAPVPNVPRVQFTTQRSSPFPGASVTSRAETIV